jgi:hypothetical protein
LIVIERIVGNSHDVEITRSERSLAEHCGVEIFLCCPTPAIVEVDQDLGLGRELGVFYPCGCGVQETRDVGVGFRAAEGPEETSGYLVAYGDYCWCDSGGGETVGDVESIVVKFPGEVVDI